ncbi:hypothetical protein Q6245_28725, partial [Klebsiella pneumoniae]|uniref:hypothetical protein n=1 Tax=Klebsiella pneumoniae TaxID=573 RepID=UPI00272FDD2B
MGIGMDGAQDAVDHASVVQEVLPETLARLCSVIPARTLQVGFASLCLSTCPTFVENGIAPRPSQGPVDVHLARGHPL